jgi:hypothetical protein
MAVQREVKGVLRPFKKQLPPLPVKERGITRMRFKN